MYSLAIIIFVVSEKKAFEHFPIGSNVNLCIAVVAILDFLYMNVHLMVLYKLYVFCSGMKFKMAATAGLSLTSDPMGKMFQNASSLKPLGQLKPNCSGFREEAF
jgi:small basic protein